jgi:hypothetical protein
MGTWTPQVGMDSEGVRPDNSNFCGVCLLTDRMFTSNKVRICMAESTGLFWSLVACKLMRLLVAQDKGFQTSAAAVIAQEVAMMRS